MGDKGGDFVAVLRMGDSNCTNHLIPLVRSTAVQKLLVVRPARRPEQLVDEGIDYFDVSGRSRITGVLKALVAAIKLARRPSVRGLVSFNAVPYGIVTVIAGFVVRKPVHVGFVGTDAHNLENRWYGRLLDGILRRATVITVPGTRIATALATRAYPRNSILMVPHSVDLDRFRPAENQIRDIDILFVGSFRPVKQVDRIISAVGLMVHANPSISLVVVGDGPESRNLQELARALHLERNVDFVGFQSDPSAWYQRARTVVIASKWEGLPFMLVEALCSGAVPIAADVGDIVDILEDDVNGLVLAEDTPAAIASAVSLLIDNPVELRRMQEAGAAMRVRLSYSRASAAWEKALARFV